MYLKLTFKKNVAKKYPKIIFLIDFGQLLIRNIKHLQKNCHKYPF